MAGIKSLRISGNKILYVRLLQSIMSLDATYHFINKNIDDELNNKLEFLQL